MPLHQDMPRFADRIREDNGVLILTVVVYKPKTLCSTFQVSIIDSDNATDVVTAIRRRVYQLDGAGLNSGRTRRLKVSTAKSLKVSSEWSTKHQSLIVLDSIATARLMPDDTIDHPAGYEV